MKRRCLGQMMMHPWELEQYTFRDLLLKVQGFDELLKGEMEHTKILAYCSVKPHLKNQNTSYEEFWSAEKSKAMTEADAKALRQRYKDLGLIGRKSKLN
jgi:hypothetical protein